MLKSITIKNFRSIVEQTIEFDKFTCLVGNNDCGKSNILKALNLFFNNQTDFNTEFDFDRDYSKFAKKLNKKAKEITISITFNLPSNYKDGGEKTWKKVWRKGEKYDNLNDIISPRSKTRNLLQNKIKYQYIPAIKSNEYFKDLMSKMYDSMMDSADKKLSIINKEYSDELQKITKNLTETLSNTLDINSVIEMPKNLSVLFKNLEFSTSDNFVKEINLIHRGDGIRTRHIPSILKYIDDNMESSKVKRIFIWGYEEPENSIEFTSCRKMADELYEMSKDKQILITTHSPFFYLKGKEKNSKLYYVSKSINGDSKYINKNPKKTDRNLFNDCNDMDEVDDIDEEMGLMPLVAPYINKQSKQLELLKIKNLDLSNKLNDLVDKILIITEGKTDIKHIKTAFGCLENLDEELLNKIEFYDFNETKTLGFSELQSMLNYLSKLNNNNIIVGLFDRDENKINNWIGEKFKNLSNNVYACLIPFLENEERKKDDKICIEHYYSNDEITKTLDNNKKLYLGKEFDEFGKSNDDKFIVKGADKNPISDYNELFSTDNNKLQAISDNARLASKNEFAEYVIENPSEFNFENFRKIFDLIKEICNENKKEQDETDKKAF